MSVYTEECSDLLTEQIELRDRKSRIDELTRDLDEFNPADPADASPAEAAQAELDSIEPWTEEDQDRLDTLDALDSELSTFGGLDRAGDTNLTLIAESDFEEYAQDFTEGIVDIPDWLSCNIDWAGVADDMRGDYQDVQFDGRTYLTRS